MLNFLRKILILNYEDVEDSQVRFNHIKLGYGFNIFSNSILLLLKIALLVVVSISTSSSTGNTALSTIIPIALLADTINTLGDIVLSITTLAACKAANKDPDKEHPFGHGRIEEIMSLCVASFIVAFGIELTVESISKIVENVATTWGISSLIILSISVFIKIAQGRFNLELSKVINSNVLKSTAVDSFFDSLSTFLIFICAILSYTANIHNLDGIFGLVISLVVTFGGFKLILETSKSLMGTACNNARIEELEEIVLSYKNVYGIHDIKVHKYGPLKTFITLHIEVPESLSLKEAHDIADKIERDLEKNENLFVTIHVDPSSTQDDLIEYKNIVNFTIKRINQNLQTHDFQLSKIKDQRDRLSFDVLIPFELYKSNINYKREIISAINEALPNVEILITFDHPF